MLYRNDKYNQPISALGYGCMRFTKKGGAIDLEKAEKEVMTSIAAGVNYFDTAYIYPGSEVALGQIVERNNIREKIKIATKLPQYLIKSTDAIDKYFDEQCKRLKTDYIDYYLMHMLTDVAAWDKLVRLGIKDWIGKKKESGAIKNIGFSFHGDSDMFLKVLDAYDWDFCQIQYNYLDENTQAGVIGLKAAAKKGIPVIIMEPLRGGKLVDLLPEAAKKDIAAKGFTPAELALRWLWNQPEVTCILSGMNSMEQVEENIKVASNANPGCFTEEEFALVDRVKERINASTKVGCTGCRYCMPCPKGIDIPAVFNCYNKIYTENAKTGRKEYMQLTAFRKEMADISACIECGKCEAHCPQHIEIRKKLKEARKVLTPWYYRLGIRMLRLVKFW